MTRRVLLAALAASLVLPAAASAQITGMEHNVLFRGPHLQITPFVGHLTSVSRIEEWGFSDGAGSYYTNVDMTIGGATALGLNLETPLIGAFGLTAAGAYAPRRATTFQDLQTGERARVDGSHIFLGRLGAAFHLPPETSEFVLRRLGASAFAGGAVMYERPRDLAASGIELESGAHFGFNVGVSAHLPFAEDRFAVQLGIEDNMMWWNQRVLASLPYEYMGRPGASRDQTVATTDMSHAWLLRAGISLRLR
jgi:hypothetical protein